MIKYKNKAHVHVLIEVSNLVGHSIHSYACKFNLVLGEE